ncbi:GerMN domain-containing protein [Sediminibacillus massiliensis]|uniref:GerMN domain-containing protein n=1 Tax=Sediminibacillus massiliensis TaxID=1926277 RepID=UPI00098833A0|nr:GerMN domain-containing protein [Sediminibacillus massiliensis]
MGKRSIIGFIGLGSLALALTGCGIFQGEQVLKEIDNPPEEATYTDNLDEVSEESQEQENNTTDENEAGEVTEPETGESGDTGEEVDATVKRQLYLLDANGMVVPQTLELPKAESNEVAKQALEYLVKGGPVTELLPNGFEAVLPTGTEIISLNLKDGTLTVDVSKEFAEYRPEDEQKILQAMTYTLTQFENVERIKLWINGQVKEEMPVNGTPIVDGYSRANGINIHSKDGVDLMDSEAVTLYYPAQDGDLVYHVPVTQHVETSDLEDYSSIVQALVDGPSFELNLLHIFNPGTSLAEDPTVENGVINLTFNENILNNVEEASITDEVMETLVLTLTDISGIDAVNVEVENIEQVFNEGGTAYTEPVTRETFVPTESL